MALSGRRMIAKPRLLLEVKRTPRIKKAGPLMTHHRHFADPAKGFRSAQQTGYDAPPGLLGEAMRRRDFIQFIASSAAAWPITARAQQPASSVGFLHFGSPGLFTFQRVAFEQGLKEKGYLAGQNVEIEGRKADTALV
jgi:hypothetical protein